MSEHIDNSKFRKLKLKELILKLHEGEDEETVKEELKDSLRSIPYGEVIEVEQELIEEGLPEEEVLRLCDVHSSVLQGSVDQSSAREVPAGHPLDVLMQENKALNTLCSETNMLLAVLNTADEEGIPGFVLELISKYNLLIDVDKHYQRKEYLVFPYLEKTGITGPPKVMWGKHDEIRELLKGSLEILNTPDVGKEDLLASTELILKPAVKGVAEMIIKEEEILFPMLMDALSDSDWYEVQKQSLEIGFCIIDPKEDWKPAGTVPEENVMPQHVGGNIQLPTGSFSTEELLSILNTMPVDMTFVDKDDKVKYFSQSRDRIFQRNRAIINRDVRHCHPPGSAHIVDKIIDDFKNGKQDRAPFWIKMGPKFIHIEYFALRNDKGDYLGTLEVSHDLTEYRALEGEQRILSYK